MKIKELLEGPINTSLRTKQLGAELGNFRNKRYSPIGDSGAFSNVKDDYGDPHMIKKSSNKAIRAGVDEGFRVFIEFIVKNGYADNPHFPRVYKANKIVGKDGYAVDSYKVEKLLTKTQVDEEALVGLVKALLPNYKREIHEYNAASILADEIEAETYKQLNRFELESLNDACRIIAELVASNKSVSTDLHTGNIMFRRTQHGIQVVLNDPIPHSPLHLDRTEPRCRPSTFPPLELDIPPLPFPHRPRDNATETDQTFSETC